MALHNDGFYYDYFSALTREQMQVNAKWIASFFLDKGWTINAIAGMMGNFEAESTINPARWENNTDYRAQGVSNKGFGLAQWTPWSKYINWCSANGLTEYHIRSACHRIYAEFVSPGSLSGYGDGQYFPTSEFDVSRDEFIHSTMSAGELAKIFVRNYERPYSVLYGTAAEKQATYDKRASMASTWYAYLTGTDLPDVPDQPSTSTRSDFVRFLTMFGVGRRVVR